MIGWSAGDSDESRSGSSTTHPGEVLLEDWLKPLEMSAYRLAQGAGMSRAAVSQILAGKRAITAETALHLSRFLGCTPQFWLGLQADYDIEEAEEGLAEDLARIRNYKELPPTDPGRLRPALRRTPAVGAHRERFAV